MLTSFPAPVLSVTADAVKDLQGHEALSGLWTCAFPFCFITGFMPLIARPICTGSVHEMQRVPPGWPQIGEHIVAVVAP